MDEMVVPDTMVGIGRMIKINGEHFQCSSGTMICRDNSLATEDDLIATFVGSIGWFAGKIMRLGSLGLEDEMVAVSMTEDGRRTAARHAVPFHLCVGIEKGEHLPSIEIVTLLEAALEQEEKALFKKIEKQLPSRLDAEILNFDQKKEECSRLWKARMEGLDHKIKELGRQARMSSDSNDKAKYLQRLSLLKNARKQQLTQYSKELISIEHERDALLQKFDPLAKGDFEADVKVLIRWKLIGIDENTNANG